MPFDRNKVFKSESDHGKAWNRGYLPHIEERGSVYFVTFRTADSLPAEIHERMLAERERILRTTGNEKEARNSYYRATELELDKGHGRCELRKPKCATIVADSLEFFNGARYDLDAWCVMPNHVHVVFSVREGFQLFSLLHSWK